MSQASGPAATDAGEDAVESLRSGLVVVLLLSALAGAVDAYGLYKLKDLFVSFMSGNTTSLGMALGRGDFPRALLIASIVAAFTAGAAVGEAFAIAFGRYHLPGVVAVVAALLLLPILIPPTTILAMTFAMGALNAALDHAGSVSVSVTYITGTLVKLGRGLARWSLRRTAKLDWLQQAVPWLGILGGALVAAICIARLGYGTFEAVPGIAALLSLGLLAAPLFGKAPKLETQRT